MMDGREEEETRKIIKFVVFSSSIKGY